LVNWLTVKFKESKFCSNQKTLAYLLKVFTLRIKLCISSNAPSRKRKITVRFRVYGIILCQQCATWSSTFRRLEFGRDFLFFRKMLNLCYKVTLVQALRLCTGRTAHRGSRGIALLFHDHDTRRGERSASRPGCSIPPGMSRYLLYRRRVGPQGRPGQVWKIAPQRDWIPGP